MKTQSLISTLIFQPIATGLIFLGLTSMLTGCDNSEKNNPVNPLGKIAEKKYSKPVELRGSVSNNEDQIKAGRIEATDMKGGIIATTEIGSSGQYTIRIPAGTVLPLLLTAYPEKSGTESEPLEVAVIDPMLKKYEINMLTTIIAKKAKALGGYSYENMSQAAMTSTSVPDSNKTTGGFRGDPTQQYGGWH